METLVHLANIAVALEAVVLIAQQLADVHSTNLALANPHVRVIEVGDEALGCGNLSALAQRSWGRWWWLIKTPLVLVLLPLVLAPVDSRIPLSICPVLLLGLFVAICYFEKIVRENYENAGITNVTT